MQLHLVEFQETVETITPYMYMYICVCFEFVNRPNDMHVVQQLLFQLVFIMRLSYTSKMSSIKLLWKAKVRTSYVTQQNEDRRLCEFQNLKVNFYRAMLCIRGTSHGPVSVCHKSEFY